MCTTTRIREPSDGDSLSSSSTLVGFPEPHVRYRRYPHELSGGMRQRAMIAIAIANRPSLLIADEPTTALDVTIQAQILDVLKRAQEESDAATLLVTHDLGLVSQIADRIVVMYAGRVVETGDIHASFSSPPAPLHDRAPRKRAATHRRRRMVDPDPGATTKSCRSSYGMPVPSPLFSLEGSSALPRRDTRASHDRSGPIGGLPLRRGARRLARGRDLSAMISDDSGNGRTLPRGDSAPRERRQALSRRRFSSTG